MDAKLLNGYEVIAAEWCADTVQAKKHRKKRINKKWKKRYGMKTVPWKDVFVIKEERKMIMHQDTLELLKKEIKGGGKQ